MRLVLGRSGSGKTTYCMNEIKKFEQEAFSKPLIYIVPEQSSFDAERQLIKAIGKSGIMNTQVLSFRRLAYRIFSEKGIKQNEISNNNNKFCQMISLQQVTKETLKITNIKSLAVCND